MKMQAFTTAAVQDQRIRARIKAALAGNLKRGENKEDFRKVIDSEFTKAGLTKLQPYQIENIYYTNTSLAFSAGQMQKMVEVSDDFPYWKYSATMDSKTRPSHAALHGKIFRMGDFSNFPPIGFRCRCTAIPLTARQAAAQGGVSTPPSDGWATGLENTEFMGNKNEKYLKWLAKEYDKADTETRAHIDKAINDLKSSITQLDYLSAKEFFRSDYVKQIEKDFLNNKEVQQIYPMLNLSRGQAFRIYSFSDWENGLSKELAKYYLVGEKPVKWTPNQLAKFRKDLNKAMGELPVVEKTVYRNLKDMPAKSLQQYKEGATIVWDTFQSSTIDDKKYSDRPIRMIIEAKTPRYIGAVSKWPNEQEALFLPGTRLLVTKTETVNGQIIIRLKQKP